MHTPSWRPAALYTDGITEAYNDAGDEFGEQSLIERLRHHRDLPCHTALTAIADEVQRFNSREQHDDITLILAKCKASQ
jgi:serine phosphatase RsbU (regulator of sigma subunit)